MSLQAIELIIPLFSIILVGYVFRKTSFVADTFVDDLNRLVFYIALPVTLFVETADMPGVSPDIAVAAVAMFAAIVLTTFAALVVSFRIQPMRRGPFVQGSYRSNLAYLGLPVVSTLLGAQSLPIIAVAIATGVITHTVVSILVLRLFQRNADALSIPQRLLEIAKNPLIVAVVLGLLVSALSIPLPSLAVDTLDLFSRVSLPLILLVVGFRLSFRNIGGSLAAAFGSALMKLVAMPLIMWAVLTWVFPATPFVRATMVLLLAMPTAVVSQSFAEVFEADEQLAAAVVSVSTLLAAVTIPVWSALVAAQ